MRLEVKDRYTDSVLRTVPSVAGLRGNPNLLELRNVENSFPQERWGLTEKQYINIIEWFLMKKCWRYWMNKNQSNLNLNLNLTPMIMMKMKVELKMDAEEEGSVKMNLSDEEAQPEDDDSEDEESAGVVGPSQPVRNRVPTK